MKNKRKGINPFEMIRTLAAVGIAVLFSVVVIFLVSDQPLNAVYCFFVEPLLSFRYWSNIIELMTPLLFTGLAMTFILQTKVYNLAVEGMFYVGGMSAAMAAILLHMGSGLHAVTALPVSYTHLDVDKRQGSDRGIDSVSLAERFWESRPERVKAP